MYCGKEEAWSETNRIWENRWRDSVFQVRTTSAYSRFSIFDAENASLNSECCSPTEYLNLQICV